MVRFLRVLPPPSCKVAELQWENQECRQDLRLRIEGDVLPTAV